MSDIRKRKQAAIRAKRLRDKRKANGNNEIRVTLSPDETTKLDDICQFFAYPSEPYTQIESLQSLIHRVHAEIPEIERDLGCCGKCGEQLPQGCTKLLEGGLFYGDAMCWHTTNRVRIIPIAKGVQS
ncbi:hypothetical protein [Vibrio sagamiensis]|uniref:Uncharacterized protein n=1 Tax=Vibrio sagamiensis NBRC 104589 TaxID=1219064 RepID=A0A511QJK5_9VIBR|nr:hypothetical protein [Vibrio sagamiensis]PNQ54570.1 hypothetical protein C1141_15185 [Vibrio agarivorans]GEM77510.1 hypothetical protein VSA01S_36220 [Vibrio sagamiensis NBRC 104589]